MSIAILVLFLYLVSGSCFGQTDASKNAPDYANEAAMRQSAEDVHKTMLAIKEAFDKRNLLIAKNEQRIKKLPLSKQREAIKKLPAGIFVNVPAFWQTTQQPKIVLQSCYYYGEPINKDQLQALHRLFDRIQIEEQKLQAAVILYRYGNLKGRQYLKDRFLEKHESIIAETFALNHENEIFDAINDTIRSSYIESTLYAPLYDWHEPILNEAVLYRLHQSVIRGQVEPQDRLNNYYIESFIRLAGSHALVAAREDIEKAYYLPDQNVKLAATVALSRLFPDNYPEITSFVSNILDGIAKGEGDDDDPRQRDLILISNMVVIKDPTVLSVLRKLTMQYLTKQTDNTNYRSGKYSLDTMVVAMAATAFARYQSKEDTKSVEKILNRMREEKVENAIMRDVGMALFRLRPTSPILKSVMGERWVRSQMLTASLKKIPKQFQLDIQTVYLK